MKPRTKQIRFGPKIAEGDYQKKLRNMKKILSKGYRVRIQMVFRGREMILEPSGREIFNRLIEDLKHEAKPVNQITLKGRVLSVLLEAR
jgi:translation initiation factor IF-3